MSEFQLEHKTGNEYDNRATVEVRLKLNPSAEDYTKLTDAIGVIKSVADKYIGTPIEIK